ncbi:MAG: DUF2474 family protein [Rhodospirillales bacterium]
MGVPRQGRPVGGISLKPGLKRLAWFAGLWVAGVATLGAIAYVIRLFLIP